MKTNVRRRLLLAVPVLLSMLLAAAVLVFRENKKPGYMTAAVGRNDIETTVLATGTVESDNMVSVGAQVSGQLKTLKVELGNAVKAGQLVAEIDSLPQQNTLRIKTAALAAIRAQKQAKEAALIQAKLALERQTQMVQADASSREDLENAQATCDITTADIANLDAQIEQAKTAVDTAQLDLGYTKICSPIDGVVVAIITKEGQTVNASQSAPTIIKVARLDRMTIRVEISEADVVRVKAGQRIYFTILGEPDIRYAATLQAIEPAPESIATESSTSSSSSNASGTASSSSTTAVYYIGILDVPNTDGKLRISMTAQVHIVLREARNALTIPAAALGEKDAEGRSLVKVETAPDKLEQHWVRTGINDNVQAEILEGLQEGQRVVIGEQISGTAPAPSSSRPHGPPPGML